EDPRGWHRVQFSGVSGSGISYAHRWRVVGGLGGPGTDARAGARIMRARGRRLGPRTRARDSRNAHARNGIRARFTAHARVPAVQIALECIAKRSSPTSSI